MQVFNAATQQLEDVTWTVDQNQELVATFKDESFLKFPAGTTEKELKVQITTHEKANKGQEVITPEMEAALAKEKEAAEALAAKLNATSEVETPDSTT